MRINTRIKLLGYTFFFMVSHTQTLEGFTSKLKNGKHIVMLDCENVELFEELYINMLHIKEKFDLGEIFIASDIEKSYRVWCFTQVEFKTLLKIMLDCPYLDWNFFYWTVQRGKATLRTSKKINRLPQKIVAHIQGRIEPIPETMEKVIYDTGFDKMGFNIMVG